MSDEQLPRANWKAASVIGGLEKLRRDVRSARNLLLDTADEMFLPKGQKDPNKSREWKRLGVRANEIRAAAQRLGFELRSVPSITLDRADDEANLTGWCCDSIALLSILGQTNFRRNFGIGTTN